MNKYDKFIDLLEENFSVIPNFHLTQEEGTGKEIFDFVLKRYSEIYSLKSLFIDYYLPSALKAASNDLNEISNSKYKSLIKLTEDDLKENYYEIVRLGYIAIYHKYEIYIKDLLTKAELLYVEIGDNNVSLEKYIEKSFGFKIHEVWYSPNLHRINYICNCTKHFDGYPKKTNKPKAFENLPEDKKLTFSENDLIKDIDFLINHYHSLFNTLMVLACHKMLNEGVLQDLSEIQAGPDRDKILEQKLIVDNNARQLIDTLKQK